MTSLEPGQLWLLRIHAAIASLILAAGATIGEATLVTGLGLPRGILLAPVAVLVIYALFVSPGRHYRAWGYGMDADELHLRHGVWTQVETTVPIDRIQHIDVSQGPLERPLGICRLIVHTAGTQHSRVVLPGLSRATAERMRDEIRARIRQELE